MVTATFRFYEELNDFLAPARRKQEFTMVCAAATATKHMIEALVVCPHLGRQAHYQRFSICDGCGRVYWEGSHWRNMRRVLDGVLVDEQAQGRMK